MLEQKIKSLLEEQHKKVKDLCESIDMTDTGLRKIYARDSCELSTLKKIANFFNVSPSFFLDGPSIYTGEGGISVGGNASDVNSYKIVHAMIAEMAAQRQMTEKAFERIDRLIDVIEKLSNRTIVAP